MIYKIFVLQSATRRGQHSMFYEHSVIFLDNKSLISVSCGPNSVAPALRTCGKSGQKRSVFFLPQHIYHVLSPIFLSPIFLSPILLHSGVAPLLFRSVSLRQGPPPITCGYSSRAPTTATTSPPLLPFPRTCLLGLRNVAKFGPLRHASYAPDLLSRVQPCKNACPHRASAYTVMRVLPTLQDLGAGSQSSNCALDK